MINRGYNSERMGESPEITYSIPRWCTTDNIPSSSMQPVYRFYHYVEERPGRSALIQRGMHRRPEI